jgi:hypothetical protein
MKTFGENTPNVIIAKEYDGTLRLPIVQYTKNEDENSEYWKDEFSQQLENVLKDIWNCGTIQNAFNKYQPAEYNVAGLDNKTNALLYGDSGQKSYKTTVETDDLIVSVMFHSYNGIVKEISVIPHKK